MTPTRTRRRETNVQRTAQLGELIAAVFDKAARYSTDPREVSRLATTAVLHMLRRMRRVVTLTAFGALAAACTEERAQTAAPPTAVEAAVARTPIVEHPTMPGGWRDLKFGMSETDVKNVIHEYRNDSSIQWERSEATHLPTVRLNLQQIDYVLVDKNRFHTWSIRDLDESAELVQTWHDQSALVAIQLKGRALPEVFIRKASDAYSARPQAAKFKFFDERTKAQEIRDVAFWRGEDMTAFVWTAGSSPMLLLWSNVAMEGCAAAYQTALEAPATAASKAAKENENGTKF